MTAFRVDPVEGSPSVLSKFRTVRRGMLHFPDLAMAEEFGQTTYGDHMYAVEEVAEEPDATWTLGGGVVRLTTPTRARRPRLKTCAACGTKVQELEEHPVYGEMWCSSCIEDWTREETD